MVSVKAKPHKGYVTERVRSSAGIVPRLCSRGMENLVTKMIGYAKRHPGGMLPLSFKHAANKFAALAKKTGSEKKVSLFTPE